MGSQYVCLKIYLQINTYKYKYTFLLNSAYELIQLKCKKLNQAACCLNYMSIL